MGVNQKQIFRTIGATTYLAPVPVVMLGCADPEQGIRPNLITVGWAGIVNSKPPIISVSIRKERYSHAIIQRTGEFTVNLVSRELLAAMDYCGVKSGRDVDKFAACKLTAVPAPKLEKAVAVQEAPAFLSCKVNRVIELPSHDLFLADVVEVSVADRYFQKDGSINEAEMHLIAYVHGKYYPVSMPEGFYGFSVASPEALKRRMKAR